VKRPSESLEDAELVTLCVSDQRAAQESFRALYERHAPAIARFLDGLSDDDTADCLQETFLRIYRSLGRFDAARPFRPWALSIAHNVAVDRFRGKNRRPTEPLPERELPESNAVPVAIQAAHREERALYDEALEELPDFERAVFLLRQGEGLTYAAVAATLDCSVRTAKNRMRTALTLLALGLRRRGLVAGGTQ